MVKYIFFILLIFVLNDIVAQPIYHQSARFGIRAGANFSHMDFSKGSLPLDIPTKTNWQTGILTGVVVWVPLGKNFFFQPEYLFSQMGGNIETEKRLYVINYMSLPIFLNWQLGNRFSILMGPQFDLLINAKQKTENNSASIEKDIEHRSLILTGGLEFFFTNNAAVAIRYMHGINHIGLSRETGEQDFKYESFQVSLSFLF